MIRPASFILSLVYLCIVVGLASCETRQAVAPPETPGLTPNFSPTWTISVPESSPTTPPTQTHEPSPTASPIPSITHVVESSPTPTVTPTHTPSPTLEPKTSVVHAIRISYTDVAQSRQHVQELQIRLNQTATNMVGLSAGRPDWTYFKWDGHQSWWSSDIVDTDLDFLAEDVSNFGFVERVNAVVDVYAPNYIAIHPEAAAVSHWNEPSQLQVSTAALVQGPFHDLLLDMLEYIAANYAVDAISLTEMGYYVYGYGPDDLSLYQSHTGRNDWPRRANGSINPDDPSIGQWRSVVLGDFLVEAAERVHRYDVELWADVSVSWENLANEGLEYGQYYPIMLGSVDRLVVWAYTALNKYPVDYTTQIAGYIATRYDPARFVISVGMWDGMEGAISPDNLATALRYAQDAGVPHLWITPSHMMTKEHWAAVQAIWAP